MTDRDRAARLAAAVARGSGFTQPAATLVVRHLPPFTSLLSRDDATVRRVLDDPRTRTSLAGGVRDAFKEGWHRATMERLRRDHDDWLRDWWLPACTDAELDHLLRAPALRPAHHRVGWRPEHLPASTGAAEVLLDATLRRTVAGHLVVERRLADALQRNAEGVEIDAGTDPDRLPVDADQVPAGVDPDAVADVGWWSA